jgi:pilus assembly protein CpaC
MRGSFPRASQSWLISVLSLLCVALLAQSAAANEKWRYAGTGSAWRVSDSGGKVAVVNHKSIIIEFDEPYNKARIADEKIADVLPLTDRSVYVVGKGVGSTSLALLDDQKRVIAALEVDVTHDMKDLRRKIRDSIPFANVKVSEANG